MQIEDILKDSFIEWWIYYSDEVATNIRNIYQTISTKFHTKDVSIAPTGNEDIDAMIYADNGKAQYVRIPKAVAIDDKYIDFYLVKKIDISNIYILNKNQQNNAKQDQRVNSYFVNHINNLFTSHNVYMTDLLNDIFRTTYASPICNNQLLAQIIYCAFVEDDCCSNAKLKNAALAINYYNSNNPDFYLMCKWS